MDNTVLGWGSELELSFCTNYTVFISGYANVFSIYSIQFMLNIAVITLIFFRIMYSKLVLLNDYFLHLVIENCYY